MRSSPAVAEPAIPPAPELEASGEPDLFAAALGADLARWRALDPDGPAARAAGVPAERGPDEALAWARRCLEASPVHNALGLPLRPVRDDGREGDYDHGVLYDGALPLRVPGTHDWFNLLCWWRWPLTKAALNLRVVLHHAARLRELYGASAAPNRRVARDAWLQRLANLDEGGAVVRAGWLREHACVDAHGVLRRSGAPPIIGADFALCGHAALELLHRGDAAVPRLRLFIVELPEVSDAALMARVLTFSPTLAGPLGPSLEALRADPRLHSTLAAALRFGDDDPFAGPFRSLALPLAAEGEAREP